MITNSILGGKDKFAHSLNFFDITKLLETFVLVLYFLTLHTAIIFYTIAETFVLIK